MGILSVNVNTNVNTRVSKKIKADKNIRVNKIIITTAGVVLILVSWFVALGSQSPAQKQLDLINRARVLSEEGIYTTAAELLEQALTYNAPHTQQAEEALKSAYLALIDTRGYRRKYTALLEQQINRSEVKPDVFAEAAQYYLSINSLQEALTILKNGIERTSDAELIQMYEAHRYSYSINRAVFDDVTAIYNRTIQVKRDGKWGIARADGVIIIPCQYDKISTYNRSRAIVSKDGRVYAVNQHNNKIAVAPDVATDFRNLSDDRAALLFEDGWRRVTRELTPGTNVFDDIGMYTDGYAPAAQRGKWGVIDIGSKWLIEPQYDGIIQDELGRSYAQNAVFVRSGDEVRLFIKGKPTEYVFQDARPFNSTGYAAVMRGGKWGFIDNKGHVVIDFIYNDARSFAGHLAAVKLGDMWGYINSYGELVIDTEFYDAGSFDGGSAPVLTAKGWQIITLYEYQSKEKLM